MVSAAARRDFSFSSLTLGLAVLSAPSVRVAYPKLSAPEASPEHRSLLMVEEVRGGGRGWGSIEPTRVVALPSARNEAPTQGERSCNGLLPFGHHRWRSVLWWFRLPPHAFPCVELLPHSHPLRMFPHSQLKSSAWVCSPDPTFQHPALVCSGRHPLRPGGQG